MHKAICVPPNMVNDVWPHVKSYFAAAMLKVPGCDDTLDSVKADLDGAHSLLWLASDGKDINAAATTTIRKTPRGLVCLVGACGGVGVARWRHLLGEIERYALREGCFRIRFSGRRGWGRIYPDYAQPFTTFEKELV